MIQELLDQGWSYRDLPRMLPEFMSEFREIVGDSNIRWITQASYQDGTVRGQLMVSPEGLDNVRQYNMDRS